MAASQVSASSAAGGDGDGPSSTGPPSSASSSSVAPAVAPPTANAAPSNSATPQADATSTLPTRDKAALDRAIVERFQTHDWIHSAALKEAQIRLEKDTKDMLARASDYRQYREFYAAYPARLYGEGYRGYGNGYTENGSTTKIIYPSQKPRPGRRTTPALKFAKKDMKKQAEQHEELVPVRIDVDWDKIKLRDTFTFNLHERLVSVELFAAQLIEDMGLNPGVDKPVYDQVVQQIHEQLNDFYPFAFSEEDALDPELPYSAYKNDEMRILVKLNITIGAHTLVDQFEWDVNNPMNSPEDFATSMARDLSLSGEFTTAIAHCIREQSQLFTRSLYSVGHPFDGRPIEDADLVAAFLPTPLPSVFRPQQQAKDYAPYLYENTEAELERTETMFSREQRRQKRSINRRGGPQLPDLKERQRTIRTSIVSSVLPGAATHIEDSRLYKRALGSGLAGRGKRAARDGDLSDSEDSDDSVPDSPAMSQLQGTARTRGMRGAASAAAQRMANLGRSETPEAIIHHHETRTSRRVGREATREQTEEPQQYIVTLHVNPARLRKLMRDLRARQTPHSSATPTLAHQRAPSAAAPGSMGPPSTPSATNQHLPSRPPNSAPPLQGQIGRVPAPPPGPNGANPDPPPPPPDWLSAALAALLKSYPTDSFEAMMRYCAINTDTNAFVSPLVAAPPGEPLPPNIQFAWLPRIRCRDCPGKSYTAGPDTTVQNFEVHLKNRAHRERVLARLGKGMAPSAPPQGAGA